MERRQKLPNRLGKLTIGTVGPLLATTEVKLMRTVLVNWNAANTRLHSVA